MVICNGFPTTTETWFSRAAYTGIQYTPVASMPTTRQLEAQSHSLNSMRPCWVVGKLRSS